MWPTILGNKNINPRLTEPIFFNTTNEGVLPHPSDFQNEPLYDAHFGTNIA